MIKSQSYYLLIPDLIVLIRTGYYFREFALERDKRRDYLIRVKRGRRLR